MIVIGVDPGPVTSGVVVWDGERERVLHAETDVPNPMLRGDTLPYILAQDCGARGKTLAIERVACYGRPVGETVFQTVFFSGRLAEWWESTTGTAAVRVTFSDVALHHCLSMRAKESHVRQVLIDRFGGKGTKGLPGRLYGVSGHAWSALALAITVADQQRQNREGATDAERSDRARKVAAVEPAHRDVYPGDRSGQVGVEGR